MALLASMPPIQVSESELAEFGREWSRRNGALGRTPPRSSGDLGRMFDHAVADALAVMLGGIPIVEPNSNSLTPKQTDCVEIGNVRIIGGVRPQNFDVCYRPDGVRFAFDSKTLNDAKSVGKNWQNMINDLATETTTVHTRFPFAVVAFAVVIPVPCLTDSTRAAMEGTLERLARRSSVDGPHHMAEAISLVFWDPSTGRIVSDMPSPESPIRLSRFSEQIEFAYVGRYKGLPPHMD